LHRHQLQHVVALIAQDRSGDSGVVGRKNARLNLSGLVSCLVTVLWHGEEY
jgi:hypothetical protein